MSVMHFKLLTDEGGEHRFTPVADNNKAMGQSEGYTSAANAKRGALALYNAIVTDYERRKAAGLLEGGVGPDTSYTTLPGPLFTEE